MIGVVKFFDAKKGFGFITPEQGKEVFVHFSNIKMEGFRTLYQGDKVEYEIEKGDKGEQAINVVVVEKSQKTPRPNKA